MNLANVKSIYEVFLKKILKLHFENIRNIRTRTDSNTVLSSKNQNKSVSKKVERDLFLEALC